MCSSTSTQAALDLVVEWITFDVLGYMHFMYFFNFCKANFFGALILAARS